MSSLYIRKKCNVQLMCFIIYRKASFMLNAIPHFFMVLLHFEKKATFKVMHEHLSVNNCFSRFEEISTASLNKSQISLDWSWSVGNYVVISVFILLYNRNIPLSVPRIIQLRLETSLQSWTGDWLKLETSLQSWVADWLGMRVVSDLVQLIGLGPFSDLTSHML